MRTRRRTGGIDLLDVSGTRAAVVFGIALALSCYPLFAHRFMSINDMLNHLARAWILLHLNSTPAFRHEYAANWRMLPDLALDLYSHVLGRLLPLPLVGKSFVALAFVLLLSGTSAVHHALYRKWSLWPLAAALLLYNRVLLAGQVNFLFAVGLYLHVTALWIGLRERAWPWRVGAACAGTLVIFFAHLFPVGLLAVTLGGYEIGRGLRRRPPLVVMVRDLLVIALPFVAPAIIALVWTPHSATSFVVAYRSLPSRLAAFAAPLVYRPPLEAGGFAALSGILAWHAWRGRVRCDSGLAVALLLLFVVQLAMPNKLFTAEGADHRIPIAWYFLAIGAIDIAGETRRAANFVVASLCLLLVGRIAIVETRWAADAPLYRNIAEGLNKLPSGATVALGLPPGAFADSSRPGIAALYLPSWEVARRGGFTQTVFAIPTQHPLIMRPEYARLAASAPPDRVWREFDRSKACPSTSAKAETPPRSWMRFDAFAILFPARGCVESLRSMTLVYQSPALASYENRPGYRGAHHLARRRAAERRVRGVSRPRGQAGARWAAVRRPVSGD
jgi:hypothetical protein